jgi:hypothetical protein
VTRVARNLLLLAAVAVLVAPAGASATPEQVIEDCGQDGTLNRKYSNSDLRKARDNLPTDLAEYSDCRDVISAAITGGSDKGGGRGSPGHGVGGAGAADPREQGARAQDAADLQGITSGAAGGSNAGGSKDDEAPPVQVGGEPVEPGGNGLFDLASASNELPTPLLIALICVGLLALAGGSLALRQRMPALGRIPLLNKIPTPRVPFSKRK